MRPDAADRDDVALLRRAARADEEALATLYDRHAGWLTVRLTRRCAMPDVVDQAIQDTFLALWREAGSYREGGDVAAFIWGNRHPPPDRRDPQGERCPPGLPWRAAEPPVVASAEEQVLVGIEHGRLGQALAQLSPDLRGAIEATVLDGLKIPGRTARHCAHRDHRLVRRRGGRIGPDLCGDAGPMAPLHTQPARASCSLAADSAPFGLLFARTRSS